MKKLVAFLMAMTMILCLFAGCRKGTNAETLATDASRMVDDIMPRADNAHPTDGDGFIGNETRANTHPSTGNRTMPGM